MRPEDLIQNYPVLYHMAAKDSWDGIRAHGLLSTSSLLDLYEIRGQERVAIEEKHRPETVSIFHRQYGTALIRDQKPMSDDGLTRALADGLTPADWYRILNSKVFFWTNEERLHRLLCARAYRNEEHDVLWVDTRRVVDAHATDVRLCPMNSGATKPMPHPRGIASFLPIADYPWAMWVKKRGVEGAVVEVAIEHGIPQVANNVLRVVRMKQTKILSRIYER